MPPNAGPILIRTDGGATVGIGHVMRSLALAQAWIDRGGSVTFACADLADGLRTRLLAEDFQVVTVDAPRGSENDARQTVQHARHHNARWVVLDGYRFTVDFVRTLRAAGNRVLVIDDNGEMRRYEADLIVNQNAHAHEGFYRDRSSHAQLLLGLPFCLLRREFRRRLPFQRRIDDIAVKALVSLGGADIDNRTSLVLDGINHITGITLDVTVVVGSANPHREQLRLLAAQSPHRFVWADNAPDMAALMADADIAVTAGGSTSWELAAMGLPACQVIIADNQAQSAQVLASTGATELLGWADRLTPSVVAGALDRLVHSRPARQAMCLAGQALVDGRGADRVCDHMELP